MDTSNMDLWMQELAQGSVEAFAALYDRFGSDMFRVARVLLSSRQDAEDAVQEVFVALVRARRSLSEVADIRAYLFACLRSAAARIASRRRKERHTLVQDLSEVAAREPDTTNLERSEWLSRAVSALPVEQREVVALKIDAGLTFAQIASVLNISMNTAASRYRYALEKLRSAVREFNHESTRASR